MIGFTEFVGNVREWALDKGIFAKATSKDQTLKLMEEAGELAAAIIRRDKAKIKDGIGDCLVVLTILAEMESMNLDDCAFAAWNEIKNRTGEMKNGSFIKSE